MIHNLVDSNKQFYSSLPRDLIVRVYHRYRTDFEMFDYSIDETLVKAGYAPLRSDEQQQHPPAADPQ